MANRMRCSHWPAPGAGNRCREEATHHVMTPEGTPCPGSYVCEEHGRQPVAEYREKLGLAWSIARCDEFGAVLQEAHQVEQPDGEWCVFWRGRKVLDLATYVIASHIVHELDGGDCGVGECQEMAEQIRQTATA